MAAAESIPPRSAPVGTIVLLAVTAIFYIWLMVKVTGPEPAGAEGSLEQALEVFFLTICLWIALALLLFAGGIMGEMPRREAILAGVAHPLSGIGSFTAIDMASHHAGWTLVFPVLLPLLIAFCAMCSRFPRLHAALPARMAGVGIWGAILILSVLPLLAAFW